MMTTPPASIRFFVVGGAVRDRLLGLPESKDIDFAVEVNMEHDRNPEDNDISHAWSVMLEAVEARCSKVFLVTPEFLTIRGLDPTLGAVDFVLCRKDGPTKDGRRPEFVEPGTIMDDLARRDFGMNAIAMAEDGTLLDPHRGAQDIAARVIRFVGNPEDRLREDALRAFRGVRFSITKGFSLDSAARSAIRGMHADQFEAVSTERIREELLRCFAHDTWRTLNTLSQFPVLLDLALDRGIWLEPSLRKV